MARRLRSYVSPNVFVHVPWVSEAEEDKRRPGRQPSEADNSQADRVEDDRDTRHDSDSGFRKSQPKQCASPVASAKPRLRLLFFIPGNPGLIGYYRPFMSLLVKDLARHEQRSGDGRDKMETMVVGMSLGGFEVGSYDSPSMQWKIEVESEEVGALKSGSSGSTQNACGAEEDDLFYPSTSSYRPREDKKKELFSLRNQIELSYARLEFLIHKIQEDRKHLFRVNGRENEDGSKPIEVILAGHSVGAYICLELVRLWHERCHAQSPSSKQPAWKPSTCILLTPTIQDIHLSPSGVVATPLLTNFSFLPSLAQILVRSVLLKVLPTTLFTSLVSRVTGMKQGSHGLEATLAFLNSEQGVEQALYMAGWEMKEIRTDKWGEEVWGASHDEVFSSNADGRREYSSPTLFFWFAKEDHWVANVTKEAVLQSRASDVEVVRDHIAKAIEPVGIEKFEETRIDEEQQAEFSRPSPSIHIQESDGLVHAWCLQQSEVVARQVGAWLKDLGN